VEDVMKNGARKTVKVVQINEKGKGNSVLEPTSRVAGSEKWE